MPTFIKPPGAIGVFSPASPPDKDKLAVGLKKLVDFGYRTVLSKGAKRRGKYLAGSDEVRADDLMKIINYPGISGIMASRGGYGCLRILPSLDFSKMPENVPIVGYSDLTVLHLARYAATGQGGWHGPVVGQLPLQADKLQEHLGALAGAPPDDWTFHGLFCLSEGEAVGPLLGGNLTLVNALLCSPYMPSLDGAILLLEDVAEAGYKLDRLLAALWLSGRLKKVAGIVFGEFKGCGGLRAVHRLLAEFVRRLSPKIPALWCPCFGHGSRNLPWFYGEKALLKVELGQGRLTFMERRKIKS
ncbi:MAG: LD-carboxypeptidase [Deltaproteobacteria bacterium]|jgi:muramoyltetrapeptide carboxypeptidase|nr:LD-carboxypeptidase [Deltaproteobacteria bacterium]